MPMEPASISSLVTHSSSGVLIQTFRLGLNLDFVVRPPDVRGHWSQILGV
jgi:hypothetical protein